MALQFVGGLFFPLVLASQPAARHMGTAGAHPSEKDGHTGRGPPAWPPCGPHQRGPEAHLHPLPQYGSSPGHPQQSDRAAPPQRTTTLGMDRWRPRHTLVALGFRSMVALAHLANTAGTSPQRMPPLRSQGRTLPHSLAPQLPTAGHLRTEPQLPVDPPFPGTHQPRGLSRPSGGDVPHRGHAATHTRALNMHECPAHVGWLP